MPDEMPDSWFEQLLTDAQEKFVMLAEQVGGIIVHDRRFHADAIGQDIKTDAVLIECKLSFDRKTWDDAIAFQRELFKFCKRGDYERGDYVG